LRAPHDRDSPPDEGKARNPPAPRAEVLGKTGKPVKYLSIHFDITKLKEAEEKLKTGKMR